MGLNTLLAKATTFAFKTDCITASATSTLTYMTIGTATTTVTCSMGGDGAQSAVLAIEVNASSTASLFNVYTEESMNGIDYYPINNNQTASTSNPFNIAQRGYSTFAFASSTIGGVLAGSNSIGVNGTNNRNHYTLNVPVNMKYVRAYIYVTGANAGVWMQIIPKISF